MAKYGVVERDTLVSKIRRLPAPGEVLVRLGDEVKETTPIARGSVRNQEIVEVRVGQKLGIDPMNLGGYMLKKEGDTIKKDDILALRRSFFGSSTRICRAPIDGTIEAFSTSTGTLLIRGLPIQIEVKAHIPGKVKELFPLEGAVIEGSGSIIRGAVGVGREARGLVEVLASSPKDILTDEQIKKTHAGKVIVGGAAATIEALRKAQSIGIAAIVVGGVDEKEITELLGYELDLADTGMGQIGFTLVSISGFGEQTLDDDALQLFRDKEGMLTCVDGTTQIRTRMQRPEIIIPY